MDSPSPPVQEAQVQPVERAGGQWKWIAPLYLRIFEVREGR